MCAIAIVWQDVSTVLTLKTPAILAKHMRKYTIANNGCIDGIYNFCNSLTSVDAAIEEFPKELQVKADPNIPKKCINTSWPWGNRVELCHWMSNWANWISREFE